MSVCLCDHRMVLSDDGFALLIVYIHDSSSCDIAFCSVWVWYSILSNKDAISCYDYETCVDIWPFRFFVYTGINAFSVND